MTTHKQDTPTPQDVLQAKITLETAQISWRELQRFFAAGRAIAIDSALDLVQVAAEFSSDNKALFENWLAQELVAPVTDDQAEQWYENDDVVWAVVVAPWVLVQAQIEKP